MSQTSQHVPVLVDAVLDGLQVAARPDGLFVDATVGLGGHSEAILTATRSARVLGFDRDLEALAIACQRLSGYGERFQPVHAGYDRLGDALRDLSWDKVDGVLFDLGLSSLQLDDPKRGFSFRADAPLDMRFDPTSDRPTAADLINTLTESALADLLYEYGEEPHSRRLARAIVEHRPIETTTQLAEVISAATHSPRSQKIHPATRTFQALRIAVNDELATLSRTLPIALESLKPGGRLAVISFHSLEDRIVKQFFKRESTDCLCPPHQPVCTCGHKAQLRLITHKPIEADANEVAANPRSRSAKLRVAEKL